MKFLILIICASIGSNSYSQDVVEVPQIGVSVKLGEWVMFKGVTVQFDKILEDSRCPKMVDCIWAGRVIAQITYTDDDSYGETKALIFGEIKGNESADKTICTLRDGTIVGKMVYPYPNKAGEKLDYKLLIDWNLSD